MLELNDQLEWCILFQGPLPMWWRLDKGLLLKQEVQHQRNAQERQKDVTVVGRLLLFDKFPNNLITLETTIWQSAQADVYC